MEWTNWLLDCFPDWAIDSSLTFLFSANMSACIWIRTIFFLVFKIDWKQVLLIVVNLDFCISSIGLQFLLYKYLIYRTILYCIAKVKWFCLRAIVIEQFIKTLFCLLEQIYTVKATFDYSVLRVLWLVSGESFFLLAWSFRLTIKWQCIFSSLSERLRSKWILP